MWRMWRIGIVEPQPPSLTNWVRVSNWLLILVCNPNVSLWSIPHKRKVLLPMIAQGNFTFYSIYGLSIYK